MIGLVRPPWPMVDFGGSDRRLAESLSAAMKSQARLLGLRRTEAAERAGMDVTEVFGGLELSYDGSTAD